MAPAAQGAGGVLVGDAGRGARPDRHAAALHPDPDAVARRRAGGLPHHHRRVHRRRPAGAAPLAVPGAGGHAGQRGRRRRRRPGFRAAARRGPGAGHRPAPVDPGQPGLRLVRLVLGGPGPHQRRRPPVPVGGRGGVAGGDDVRPAGPGVAGRAGPGGRHGHLGGPRRNAFTAAVLADADPAATSASCARRSPRWSTTSATPRSPSPSNRLRGQRVSTITPSRC